MRIDYVASREKKKQVRGEKVDSLVVTVMRGEIALLFDGDEESQMRLDRFSRRAKANGLLSIPWTMADNTEREVTPEEMEQALDLAMEKQGVLWSL
jgi:hypothetical protein